MKQGRYTTEFWLTIVSAIAVQLQPLISHTANTEWNAALTAALAGIYTFGRSYAKGKTAAATPTS